MTRWLHLGLLMLCGCIAHRGDDWSPGPAPAPEPGRVRIVLLGDAGAPTKEADATAERLADVLDTQRRAGPPPIVLWLGNNSHSGKRKTPCPPLGDAGPLSVPLHEVADAHVAANGASFAVAGEVEHKCGRAAVGPDTGLPFRRPAPQYVVSVDAEGSTFVRWTCTAVGCQEQTPPTAPIVELVMADPTPWTVRVPDGDTALRALDNLLDVLDDEAREARPPRILVSHYPVEAAGEHGMAGYVGDATIHTLYPRLRDAVLAGQFDGVFAAHDHATYAHPDLTDAIKRSDKTWTTAPLWQVVAGAASMPVNASSRGAPKTRYYTSSAYVPDVYTPRTGFAVVELEGDEVIATLHAKARKWSTTQLRMPLRRPPHRTETPSPTMAPCVRCQEIPPPER